MRPTTSYNPRKKGISNNNLNSTMPTTAPNYSNNDKNENIGNVPLMAPQSPRSSSSYSRYRGPNKTIKPEGSGMNKNELVEEKNPLTHLLQSRIRATSASGPHRPASAAHAPQTPKPPPPPANSQHHNSSLTLSYGAIESSRDYEFNPDMTVDEAIMYLSQHPECQFLHVTTVSALDKYANTTFYDLVVLEKPGYPESGLVWSKRDRKRQFLLHEQVMQLSLNNLLYVDEFHGNVSLPLSQYLSEREIVRKLRLKGVFRYYLESKVFYYWRRHVHRARYERRRNELETKSFFSDAPLVTGRLEIRFVIYSLHCSTDLFAYHPPGSVNIVNFLSQQIQRIEEMTDMIKRSIGELFVKISALYEIIVSNDYLAEEMKCIIAHHPYSKGLKLPNQPVDSDGNIVWEEVRAIQRLKNEGLQKIIRLLVVGQYMLDHVLVDVMEKFWLRFSQQTRGVPRLNKLKGRLAVWSIDDFSQLNGYFSPEVVDIPLNSIEHQTQVLDPQRIPSSQVFSSQLLAGVDGNYLISKDSQSTGSYLKVDIALMNVMMDETLTPLHIDLENNSWSISTVKVRPIPTKQFTSKLVQDVYKALSRFLEEIPNMRDHPVVIKGALQKPKVDLSEDELERLQSDGGSSNSRYFTNLKMSSILASPSLFTLAVKCMHQIREAYAQSISIEPALSFLNSSFRRIWLINVESLCKQVDRSFLLVKIRDVIERDVMVIDDLENVVARDQSKFNAITRSVEQLQQTRNLTHQLYDIRHSSGMVTCFDNILTQLDAARVYQMNRILLKLPLAFITRCRAFSEYCSKLKAYYTNDSNSLPDIVFILLKLKNFDRAKVMFDAEMDICESLYALIIQYLPSDISFTDTITSEVTDDRPTLSRKNSFLSRRMNSTVSNILQKHRQNVVNDYSQYAKDRDQLWELVGKSRMFVLSHLVQIGSQIRYEINSLHLEISDLSSRVAQADLTKIANLMHHSSSLSDHSPTQSVSPRSPVSPTSDLKNKSKTLLQRYDRGALSDTYSILRELGGAINLLRQKITTNIHSQQLVHEGNDIVGSAIVGLEERDMDSFVDMDILEDLFRSKYRACTTIVEINDAVRSMSTVRLGTCDVTGIFKTYSSSLETLKFLKSKKGNESTAHLLQGLLESLRPVLELAACLKSDSMKLRHWNSLNQNVFEPCRMELSFDGGDTMDHIRLKSLPETITRENSDTVPFHDGSFRSISVQSIFERGVGNRLHNIQSITANACVENMIEKTLYTIYNTMKSCHVELSSNWMENDPCVSEKMFFQLQQVVNCTQLGIIIQYCLRAITVIEHTAIDMKLTLFNKTIDYLYNILTDMLHFIKNIELIQHQWLITFPYVKYSPQGELDRETDRLYQATTEEIKRIEILLQNSDPKTLFAALNQSYEQSISTNLPLANLQNIIEDINSNTQSMLDAYPRLSLLPYHRTKKLIKFWNIGPSQYLPFVTECIRELFNGVGQLEVFDDQLTRTQKCLGVVSNDLCERISFGEVVPLNLTLDQFLKKFEYQLRLVIARSCDMIIIQYIQLLKDMTGELSLDIIYESIREIFRVRLNLVISRTKDSDLNDKPNQSIILINRCIFAENLWLCLGYPIGSIYIARSDILSLKTQFSEQWRLMLRHFADECRENLSSLQKIVLSGQQNEKFLSLCSTLLQLEISYINILEELLLCPCLDSATELWISKYQLRYLYDKYERYQNSPLEVTIGCVSVPYGLEYQGGTVVALTGHHLENAIHKVLGSAYMSKGTVFISHEKQQRVVHEAIGECVVSARDVATALGRVHTTISSLCAENNVKLFLSRLLYLDAVGSIDMTTIDHASLQMLLTTLSDMWVALERKDDYFMVGALKYPLYTRLTSNPLHMTRKKNNMNDLREHLNARGKNFFGLFVVGIASELTYTDETIMDYLSKSSFNIVSVEHSRPVDDLGLMLCVEGFKYGVLLQLIFQDIMKALYKKLQYQQTITYLSSTLLIRTIVKQCKVSIVHGRYNLTRLYGVSIPDNKLLRLESECLYSVILDQLMKLGHCSPEDFEETHRLVRAIMQEHLDNVVDVEHRFELSMPTSYAIPDRTRRIISQSMEELGYAQGSMFMEQCSILWKLISANNPVIILSGPPGCGKTSIRNCVLDGIRREGFDTGNEFSNVSALQNWRSAKILCRVVKKWLSLRKNVSNKKNVSVKPQEASKEHARQVYSTVIHHSSLTLEYILGSFDESGRWQDGLLLRQLRATDDIAEKHPGGRLSQILILQGPLGSHLEQLLSVTQYSNHANVTSVAADAHRVSFPSGEMCVLDPSVTILLETSDLTMASPPFLMQLPQVSCGVTPDYCAERMLSVWFQSLTAWLRQFPPWKDVISEINNVLLKSDFIKDMLRCDMTSSEMNSITAVTRTSTFLRYLEQLLQQVHELTLQECSWQNESLLQKQSSIPLDALNTFSVDEHSSFDNISVDSDIEDELESSGVDSRPRSHRFPPLSLKERERLNSRVKLVLAYSAVWGFGGGVNGTKRRMFFDMLARQSIETYLSSSLYLPYECNLFEISLDLKECCFIHSLTMTRLLPKVNSQEVRKKEFVGNEEIVEAAVRTSISSQDYNLPKINLVTASMCGAKAALHLLMQSGANVLLTGLPGSGKTTLIRELLESVGKSCPSPQTMREDIMKKLLEIVGDGVIPDGIPAVLNLLEKVIYDLNKLPLIEDKIATDSLIWKQIQSKIKTFSTVKSAYDHCQKNTIFSYSTSIKNHSSASSFRQWLIREMRSETDGVLEPPRGTFGLIFIDDMHLCCDDNLDEYFKIVKDTNRVVCDRVDGLIRGLVEDSPAFGILKNLSKAPTSLTPKMPLVAEQMSTLHKEFFTQPTRPGLPKEENYYINQLGVILAATGDIKSLQKSLAFSSIMTHFCVIGIPLLSEDEVRSFLVHGVKDAVMSGSPLESPISDLTKLLRELTSFTLSVANTIRKNENICTPLEKSILKNTLPQITFIKRLCSSFYCAARHLTTTSSLLHLWCHEWKRNVVDPLPYGGLKQRYQWAWREKLNRVDVITWNLSPRWLQSFMEEFNQSSDPIWANCNLFESQCLMNSQFQKEPLELDYLPLRFDISKFDHLYNPHNNPNGSNEELVDLHENTELDIPDSTGMNNLRSVMYPHAMSNVLRMLRILNSTNSNILILSGVGSCIRTGIKVAAAFSGLRPYFFDCANRPMSLAHGVSEDLRIAFDIQRFLKNVILEAAGYCYSVDQKSRGVMYERIPPKKILAVIFSSQLLSSIDRKKLLCIMNKSDPSSLFTDAEILGMVIALRKAIVEENLLLSKQQLGLKIVEESKNDSGELNPTQETSKLDRVIDLSGRINNLIKRTPVIAGYTFQWLKGQIIRSIQENLRIALCVDIPRAVEYSMPSEAQKMLDFGDKFDSRTDDFNAKTVNQTNLTMSASSRTLKRFTLLSKSALYHQAYGGITKADSHKKGQASENVVSEGKSDSEWTSSEFLNSVADVINPADINIFTCPILGGVIQYTCIPIWWDAQREEAALGICNALLSPNKSSHFGSYHQVSTPVDIVIPFQSGLNMSKQISVSAHIVERNFMKILSNIPSLGVLGSFSTQNIFEDPDMIGSRRHRSLMGRRISLLAATEINFPTNLSVLDEEINGYVDRMLAESQSLLATLLSHPLPSDTLLLSQPVLCLSPERESEIACMIVRSILEAGVRMLVMRKQNLCDAMLLENDALVVLNSLQPVRECLEQSQKEIMVGMRTISKKLSDIKNEMITISTNAVETAEFKLQSEYLSMLQEDIESCDRQVAYQYHLHESNLHFSRTLIKSIQARDWVEFSKLFTGKSTPKRLIYAMCSLLMIVNQIPHEEVMQIYDDSAFISKMSLSALKSMEFVNSVSNFKPSALLSSQYLHLCRLNKLIKEEQADHDDDTLADTNLEGDSSVTVSTHSVSKRFDISASIIESQTTEEKLFAYLYQLQELFEFYEYIDIYENQISSRKDDLNSLQQAIIEERNAKTKILEREHKMIESDLHALDNAFIQNKERLIRIASLQSSPELIEESYFPSIKENANYLRKEVAQIDNILEHIVADCCVAATLLVRVGWLPDQIRQESLDSLRGFLKTETSFQPTDSPYVLGCLVDRLQIRTWTPYAKNALLRDPPSINSMSLFYLSPAYTFIIDPDGIAENAIFPLVSEECILYQVTGVAFNLDALENTIQRGRLVDESKLTILVTDIQAGASPDLITMLSSDIDTYESDASESQQKSANLRRDLDLRCTFNSQQTLDKHKSLILLPRVRIILISTEPPTLDHEGVGRPLPPSCFKNMTIIHWVSSVTNSFYIDSKPLASTMNKAHSGTTLVESYIMETLHERISPISKLNLINTRIIDYTLELYLAESAAYNAVLNWVKTKKETFALPERLLRYVHQQPLDLSFLESDECCRILLESHNKRTLLSKSFINIEKLERDSLMYHKVFLDACSMVANFIRMCRLLIPSSDFPPYALNVVTICAKCVRPFMNSPRFRKYCRSIPESMQNLKRFNRGLKLLQNQIRKRIRRSVSGESPPNISAVVISTPSPSNRVKKSSISGPGDSPHRRLSLVLKANQISEFVHISMSERERLMDDLAVLVQPLRTKLLQAVFDYAHIQVHPGKEWLVKLSLTLCAWSQASLPPAEELRTFLNFMNQRSNPHTTLYSVNSSEKKDDAQIGQDRKSVMQRNSSARKPTAFSSNTFSNVDVSPRAETFWVKENTQSRPTALLLSHAVKDAEWMIRGDGVLDGVWINQHSLRWRISYLPARQEIKRGFDGFILARPNSYWDPVFCDASKPQIVTKNALFQAIARGEDFFLLEWMRLLGMKPHHDFYSKSLIKGGQAKFSTAVLTVLHKSKVAKKTEVAGSSKRSPLSKRLTGTAQMSPQQSTGNSSSLPTISQSPSSSTQLRRSIRSRTIRKQSILFHNPVVPSPSGELSLSIEFSKQQAHTAQEESLSHEAEKFSMALRKPAASIAIKPQAANTGFRLPAKETQPELKKLPSNSFYNEQKSLTSLLSTSEARTNFKLLEKHSNLAPIFHGMSMGVGQYLEEFIEWKSFLESLSGKNFRNLSIEELVHLTAKLIPPQLESDETSTLGLWASGKELSVLQTFLLVFTVAPSACEAVANIYFSLCLNYLRNGNVILKHVDESWEDERSDSDDDEESEDDENSNMKFEGIKEEDEDEDDDVIENEDSPSIDIEESEPSVDTLTSLSLTKDVGRFQDGIFDLNCWTKLKRVAAGTEKGRRVDQSTKRSKWQLSCRDFENWESVLVNVYTKFPDASKSSVMKSIRDSFEGCGPLFLATDQPHHHMASITHRAREYATNTSLQSSNFIITNCRLDILDSFYQSGDVSVESVKPLALKMKNLREKVGVLTKSLTVLADPTSKTFHAVEMIDLNSSFGNVLIESAFHRVPYELASSSISVGQVSPNKRKSTDSQVLPSPTKRSSVSIDHEFVGITGPKNPKVSSIVSAEWNYLHSYQKGKLGPENTKAFGTAPFLYVGLLHTHWLHQYTLQDIVGCATSSLSYTTKIQTKLRSLEQANLCVSPVISRGVIIDELEGSVLYIMQSLKKSARTKLNRSICEKLRYSSKLEIMCTSSVYILWKMSLTLHCKLQELNDQPGCWSACLETLSLWQAARIVLKIADILKPSKWEHILKGRGSATASEYAAEIRKDSTFCRLIWLLVESFCRISFEGNVAEKIMEDEPSNIKNKRARLSILIRQESLQGKDPEDFLANYREVMSKSPTKFRNAIAKESKSDPQPSDSNAIPRRPIKEKPSVIRRRKREKERLEAAAALANNAHRVSFESLSSLTLHTLGPNRRHFVSIELRNRVAASVAVYLSHIIAAQKVTSKNSTSIHLQKRVSSLLPFAKALPDQVNIASPPKINQIRTEERNFVDPGERWPKIDWRSCDITVGSLQWNEVLSTLLLWTRSDLLIGVESTELDVARRRTSYAKLRSSILQWAKSELPKFSMSDSLSFHS